MIIVLGLIIAVVADVAGVLGNGDTHGLAHGFSVLGYHVHGSGTVFLYGIAVGAIALFGLWLLQAGARRTSRRGRAARQGLRKSRQETAVSRQETAAVAKDRDELIGQRDTARAYTASAMTPAPGAAPGPSPDNGRQPSQDQGRPSRPRLFGRRPAPAPQAAAPQAAAPQAAAPQAAAPQAVSADPEPLTAQAAPDVPAGAPAPQKTHEKSASHEHRQEARAQGRSGQRQLQEDRRPAHRQQAPARRGPR